jgi:hypothetical protein
LKIKKTPTSLSRFFIGYWILHEAGFLSGLFLFTDPLYNIHTFLSFLCHQFQV